ncbi:MAG: Dps family protein [Rhodothalassiaceae bacterium]
MDELSPKPETKPVRSGIDPEDTKALATHLSQALADSYVLYLKTQATHWNVVGPMFYSVHNLTEEQYEDLQEAVDDIAERIRAIGHLAPGCFSEFTERSIVDSVPMKAEARDMIETLAKDNVAVAKRMREAVRKAEEMEDVYTADLLTARIGAHEEAAWMLRALGTA